MVQLQPLAMEQSRLFMVVEQFQLYLIEQFQPLVVEVQTLF
jgi:hypothetical protein